MYGGRGDTENPVISAPVFSLASFHHRVLHHDAFPIVLFRRSQYGSFVHRFFVLLLLRRRLLLRLLLESVSQAARKDLDCGRHTCETDFRCPWLSWGHASAARKQPRFACLASMLIPERDSRGIPDDQTTVAVLRCFFLAVASRVNRLAGAPYTLPRPGHGLLRVELASVRILVVGLAVSHSVGQSGIH